MDIFNVKTNEAISNSTNMYIIKLSNQKLKEWISSGQVNSILTKWTFKNRLDNPIFI